MTAGTGDAVELLSWDSEHFGFPIARVVDPSGPDRVKAAVEAADRRGVRCLTALIPLGETATITAAEDAGFRCYDVRVELGRTVRRDLPEEDGIRIASSQDLPGLGAIARTRFAVSRFSVDPNFPAARVGDLYVAWVRRGIETEDREVLATSQLDGFVVCHFDDVAGTGSIELIAVSSQVEGEGSADRLMCAAERSFAQAGLAGARVVTQGANVSAQRLYQRHGYRTRDAMLWLHRWAS